MTQNGHRHSWRLILRLPEGYEDETSQLFRWLRLFLIPAILEAPVNVTLELRVPEDDRPQD